MSFFELIENRYSVRGYLSKEVEAEKLQKVLEAAAIAPTAANKQAFKVIVIPTEKYKEQLQRLYGRPWFLEAPYILGVYTIPSENWVRKDGVNYHHVDAAIVMDHIVLAAEAQGLGTCWIAAFEPEVAKELFPDLNLEAVVFTPLGYGNPEAPRREKSRKSLSDLVIYL